MQNTTETIEVLNDLIQIHNDRIAGYEKAIKETKPEDDDLKVLFATMISESHRMRIALSTEVQALGANIEQGTTTTGKLYRAWMDVKAAFGGTSRHAILASCETGEDAAQKAYRTALDADLPTFILDLLAQQQEALRASHDEVKALRDQYA
ncbi:MAG: PA2169 family four-helix-bundle protein [Bacteroidetes bacterium]|nr:PA2169 family four-helix-bundle protein [Bacteroidota bacterium]